MTQPRSTYRRLNHSIAWNAAQAAKLAETPLCEICGRDADEAHRVSGPPPDPNLPPGRLALALQSPCCSAPPYPLEDLQSICRPCHDATLCPRDPVAENQWP